MAAPAAHLSYAVDAPALTAIARMAGQYLRRKFGDALAVQYKDERNIFTEADREAEEMLIAALTARYPEDSFYGEERRLVMRNPRNVWFVDALDGTTNFTAGVPLFAVQFALLAEGDVQAGVIHVPMTEETFVAVRGAGAFRNGVRIRVAEPRGDDLLKAVVVLSRSARQEEIERHARIYPTMANTVRTVRVVNSAAGDFTRIATGGFHASVHNGANLYDILPGLLLIREAGGTVTDFTGVPHAFPVTATEAALRTFLNVRVDLLAAAPRLHERLLPVLTPFAAAPVSLRSD